MRTSPKRKTIPTAAPARVDPSRTGTLRRALSAAVGRMWGELKADLITLIARDDALGGKVDPADPFALNAYCPTGPGGGIDNTCPPASKRGAGWTYQGHLDATSGTLPDGRKVRFVKARTGARYVLRMVDPKVLDREWSTDRGFYVPPGGGGAEIQGRRERFARFLDTGRPIEATVVYLNKIRGGVSIDDGRHRFSVLRDKGIDRVGITVTREQADELDTLLGTRPLVNTRWKHAPDPQKVEAFRRWLREEMGLKVRGKVNDDVWRSYVTRAFQQGASRARGRVTRGRTGRSPSPQEQILAGGQAFHPASYERVEGLVGRVLTELDGLTAATETRAVRALADGLATGQHPREIAKKLAEEVDIARAKAELIVRTETIRAHAEGQLDEMEKMGVQTVGVEVEFLSAADDRRCPECAKLQGAVFTIKKARGVIPVHPNCRCAWAPHLGVEFERRVNKLGGVKAAVRRGAKPKKKKVTVKKKRPLILTKNVSRPDGVGTGSGHRRGADPRGGSVPRTTGGNETVSPDPPRPDPFKPRPDLLSDPYPQEQDWWVGDQPDLYPDDEEDVDERD